MKIGILQTGHAPDALLEPFGDYDLMFKKLLAGQGFTFENYRVVDMEFPGGPDAADGWLITGSRHGAYEDLPFIAPLMDLVRDIYAAAIPMVGVCFGHQIIARALGGTVEKFKGGWAVGPQTYDMNGEKVTLNAWHQDQVTERPADATVVGRNDFCENAALVYGDRAFTVQAHPEYGADFIEGLINTRGRGVVPDAQLDQALAALTPDVDQARLVRQISDFFKQPRKVPHG